MTENLRSLIINSKELNQYVINFEDMSERCEDKLNNIYMCEVSGYLSSFKGLLKLVLHNNSIKGYLVAEDLESENTLVFLKDGDIEQLGILLCDFCGLVCASEDEKYIHQRIHYFM